MVFNVPADLRTKLELHPTNNPVAVPRVARVWPGNGTLANPPLIVFNGGAGSTAAGSAGSWLLKFEVEWPEAIVVYTEATKLTDHVGGWETEVEDPHICWQPRFPHREEVTMHSDLDYIQDVLDVVDQLFNYNHDQVYVAGHSSGGFLTFSLMDFMPDTFRAFAILGSYADYGNVDDDAASIVATGQQHPSRPVLYMMGESEDVFSWQPAVDGGNDKVYDTIRQLTARNGAQVPNQGDRSYLSNLVNAVRDAEPANAVASMVFNPVKPNSAEVVLTVYGGDHSWPPKDAFDPSLRATEWIVDFFQQHQYIEFVPDIEYVPDLIPDESVLDLIPDPKDIPHAAVDLKEGSDWPSLSDNSEIRESEIPGREEELLKMLDIESIQIVSKSDAETDFPEAIGQAGLQGGNNDPTGIVGSTIGGHLNTGNITVHTEPGVGGSEAGKTEQQSNYVPRKEEVEVRLKGGVKNKLNTVIQFGGNSGGGNTVPVYGGGFVPYNPLQGAGGNPECLDGDCPELR